MERYTLEDHEAYRKEQDEKAAREKRKRREQIEKKGALAAWVREGGDPEEFETEWIWMRDEARRRRVMDLDSSAREEMRSGPTSRI
jgi:hypothetical protein